VNTRTPREPYSRIRLFVFDVDGVLTDGRIVLDDDGRQSKFFDVRDGSGIKHLQHAEIQVALLTGRSSRVVDHRAVELGITLVRQGVSDKGEELDRLLDHLGIAAGETAYMGDDLIDLPAIRRVALSFAPADARREVQAEVDHVTRAEGGRGAAREAAEILLKARGAWDEIVARYLR
jgi:3-deoxy-D-manno-octulosonate 8-phosphate phosphatase (KDO 8-P phosphatase)